MKKKITIQAICCMLLTASTCSAQHFLWGRSGGGNMPTQGINDETVIDMAADVNGNVYILSKVTTLGLNIMGQPFTGYGSEDVMLASFRTDGVLRWAKVVGTTRDDMAHWLGVDSKDGVYFVCNLYKDNDPGYIDKDAQSPKNNQVGTLIKYDTSGKFQWYRHPENDTISSYYRGFNRTIAMDVDKDGNVYWLMKLYPGNYLGGALKTTTFSTYVIKSNAAGNLSYIKTDLEIEGTVIGTTAMTLDVANGRFYLSGEKQNGTLTMGGNAVSGRMFVGCFKLDGSFLWMKENTAGTAAFQSRSVIDGSGNIYLAGYAHAGGKTTPPRPDAVFNGYTVKLGGGSATPFVVKMDKNGNLIWAREANVNAVSGANAIALRDNDELVIAGDFPGSIEWPGYAGKLTTPLNNAYDMFVTRLSTKDGTVLGLDRINSGAGFSEFPNRMASDGKGNVYIGGEFKEKMYVNYKDTLTITSGGQTDWFLIKYGDMWPKSVHDAGSSHHVKLYPNPATEQLVIEGASSGTTIQLLNMLGQQVLHTVSTADRKVLNMNGLVPGNYILQLTHPDGGKQSYKVEKAE